MECLPACFLHFPVRLDFLSETLLALADIEESGESELSSSPFPSVCASACKLS